jgi:hypothetical protein
MKKKCITNLPYEIQKISKQSLNHVKLIELLTTD